METDLINQVNAAKEKRMQLRQLTERLKPLQDKARTEGRTVTINELLMDYYCEYYNWKEHVFKSFDEWKSTGHRILSGEKALPLWGKMVTKIVDQQKDIHGNLIPNTGREIDYLEMEYVFNINQTWIPEYYR